MGAERRFQRRAKLKQEPAVEYGGIPLLDEESLERIGATLPRLRQLTQRVECEQLEPEDWALLRAMILEIAQEMS